MLCLCSCSSRGWARQGPKHVEDSGVTYMLLLNCALKLVEEIIPLQRSSEIYLILRRIRRDVIIYVHILSYMYIYYHICT